MAAESAREFEALEAQANGLMALFAQAGYERVAPAIIQPAGLFLDRIGEAIRARTYVFTDPDGEELCLRPDLTLPVCRLYAERLANGAPVHMPVKLCYNGPAFRMQEGRPDPLRPREFRQAGIEFFCGPAEAEADFEVVRLTIDAVRSSGLRNFMLRTGNTGLLMALLAALDMPERWRTRLQRAFWRPRAFTRELQTLSEKSVAQEPVLAAIAAPASEAETEQHLLSYLESREIPFVGARRANEIVRVLRERAADSLEKPLPQQIFGMVERYLTIKAGFPQAMDEVRAVFAEAGSPEPEALHGAQALYDRLCGHGLPPEAVVFSADFGRHFEYYTGMVFQIEIDGAGIAGHIAGGGRYDGLVRAVSAGAADCPAVGAAIHTERLLAALRGAGAS